MSGKDEETTEAEEVDVETGEASDDEVEGFAFGGLGKIGNLAGNATDVPTIETTRIRMGGPDDEIIRRHK